MNWALVTTCSPSSSPCFISIWPSSLCSPVLTWRGSNFLADDYDALIWEGTLDLGPKRELARGLVMLAGVFEWAWAPQRRELWWDNPTTVASEILLVRERVLHARYQALASHYNFSPLFCMPGRNSN